MKIKKAYGVQLSMRFYTVWRLLGNVLTDAAEMLSEIIKTETRRHQYLLESDMLTDIDKESSVRR